MSKQPNDRTIEVLVGGITGILWRAIVEINTLVATTLGGKGSTDDVNAKLIDAAEDLLLLNPLTNVQKVLIWQATANGQWLAAMEAAKRKLAY